MGSAEEIIGNIEIVVSEGDRGNRKVIAFEVRERNSHNCYGFGHSGIRVEELILGDEVMVTPNIPSGTLSGDWYALINRRTGTDYLVKPVQFAYGKSE